MSNNYGHALYYPHIHLQNDNWLKLATLYYDGLKRIVPDDFKTQDSQVVEVLNHEFEFIENVFPKGKSDLFEIAREFLDFVKNDLPSEPRLKAVFDIKDPFSNNFSYPIHEEKVAIILREPLENMGLIQKQDGYHPWIQFKPFIGALYMTFLAERIAENRKLPVVSDELIYQHLMNKSQFNYNRQMRRDLGYIQASIVIKNYIPTNIQKISLDQIIQFRNNHSEERVDFYNAINELAEKIPVTDNRTVLKDALEHNVKTIESSVKKLKFSFKSIGIKCIPGILDFSFPIWIEDYFKTQPELAVALGCGTFVGLKSIHDERNRILNKRKDSPWSYLLSVNKDLKPRNVLRQLLHV